MNRSTPFLEAKSSYKDKCNLGQCNKEINLQIETLRWISKFIPTVLYHSEFWKYSSFGNLEILWSIQEYGHLILQAKNRKDLCRLSHNPQRYTLYRIYKGEIINFTYLVLNKSTSLWSYIYRGYAKLKWSIFGNGTCPRTAGTILLLITGVLL